MMRMKKKRVFLESMIRLEERDLEVIKLENRQARQALAEFERNVEAANKAIAELECLIRLALSGKQPFSIDELQNQRRYLAHQRNRLAEHEARKGQALAMTERIGKQLVQKQKKLGKLRDLVGVVAKSIWQLNEKRVLKENDEIWIQSQDRGRC